MGRQVLRLAGEERQLAGPQAWAVPALTPGLYTVRLAYEGGTVHRQLVVEYPPLDVEAPPVEWLAHESARPVTAGRFASRHRGEY